jgi:urease subunit gamma/beta
MRLTAWEEERLLIFSAAELARRHRDRGLALNAPEAVALIADSMLDAARGGASYAEIEAAGRTAVDPREVLDGVAALVDEVRVEVLVGDGTRLVVLVDPLGGSGGDVPGAIRPAAHPAGADKAAADDRERRTVSVHNASRRVVRVSSHFPFERVNPRLEFDRALAAGFRLDLPAGDTVRWAPGETRDVALIRVRGEPGERR